jgi:arabinogalactan oligomer / maltooligosaccharide transport system substrate-binding protein
LFGRNSIEQANPIMISNTPGGARKMKTRFSIVSLLAVLGMLLAACQPAATPAPTTAPVVPTAVVAKPTAVPVAPTAAPTAAPAPVKLVMWTKEGGTQLDEIKGVVADFTKANPNISVDVVNYDVEALRTNFQTSALAGTGPDMLWTVNDHAGIFALADLIQPVDSLGIDSKQFVQAAYDAAMVDSKHYGIPLSYGNNLMLLVNKKLIPTVPADTDALVAAAKDFMTKNPGKYGLAWNMPEPFWLVPWLGGYGGSVFSDAGKTPTLNTPQMISAFTLLAKFKNVDKITPTECDYACMDSHFKDGTAAMIFNGDWSLGDYTNVTATKTIDLAIAPFPKIVGADVPKPFTSGTYIMFPKDLAGDKLAAALQLTNYFISKDVQLKWVKDQKRLPSIQALYSDVSITGDPVLSQAAAALVAAGVGMPPFATMRCNWDSLKPNLGSVLAGKMTPADAAAASQKAAESCIAQFK